MKTKQQFRTLCLNKLIIIALKMQLFCYLKKNSSVNCLNYDYINKLNKKKYKIII